MNPPLCSKPESLSHQDKHRNAPVAQRIEHRFPKPGVTGSNPVRGIWGADQAGTTRPFRSLSIHSTRMTRQPMLSKRLSSAPLICEMRSWLVCENAQVPPPGNWSSARKARYSPSIQRRCRRSWKSRRLFSNWRAASRFAISISGRTTGVRGLERRTSDPGPICAR